MAKHLRLPGSVESKAAAQSYVDVAASYMDVDGGGTFAQFGAKGPGSLGVKIRTVLAGVALTVLTFAAAGAATFGYAMSAPGITSTSGLTVNSGTSALQALMATSGTFSSTLSVNAIINAQKNGTSTVMGANVNLLLRNNASGADGTIQWTDAFSFNHYLSAKSGHFYFQTTAGTSIFDVSSGAFDFKTGALSGITTLDMSSTFTNTSGAMVLSSSGAAQFQIKSATGSSARIDYYVNNVLLWQAGAAVANAGKYQIYDTVNNALAISITSGATPAVAFNGNVSGVVNLTASNIRGLSSDAFVSGGGGIGYHATYGVITYGKTGSSTDWSVWTPTGGAQIIGITTGTSTVVFASNITQSTGTASLQAVTGTTSVFTTSAVVGPSDPGGSEVLRATSARFGNSTSTQNFGIGWTGAAIAFNIAGVGNVALWASSGVTLNYATTVNGDLTIASGQTLQFGSAYTAGVVVQAGYITAKDSAGTTYKLLVGV